MTQQDIPLKGPKEIQCGATFGHALARVSPSRVRPPVVCAYSIGGSELAIHYLAIREGWDNHVLHTSCFCLIVAGSFSHSDQCIIVGLIRATSKRP